MSFFGLDRTIPAVRLCEHMWGPDSICLKCNLSAVDYVEILTAELHRLHQRIDEIERGHMMIKGWTCMSQLCGAFNGEEKEPRATCRACGRAKPQ